MKIAVCITSRGLIFSKTIESILSNLKDYNYKFFISNDKSIPDAPNYVVSEALKDKDITHIFMVEEDVVVPENALENMIIEDKPIVFIDYPVGEGWSTVCKKANKILWSGLGCILIKREVFEKIEYPWFETDKSLKIKNIDTMDYVIENVTNKYGGHDIIFGIKANENGFNIYCMPNIECDHLRLQELGRPQVNNGCHIITIKDKIKNYQDYNE